MGRMGPLRVYLAWSMGLCFWRYPAAVHAWATALQSCGSLEGASLAPLLRFTTSLSGV